MQEYSKEIENTVNVGRAESTPSDYDRQTKAVAQELIKYGVLEMTSKPNYYQLCLRHRESITEILSPLDLKLEIDDIRGLAFLMVAKNIQGDVTEEQTLGEPAIEEQLEADDWQHPLVRRQRMNMEQSLMVAILRQQYIAHELEAGVGEQNASVFLDVLLPLLNQFLGVTGSEEQDDKRLRRLLEQLKSYGLVTDIDEHERVIIRPLIAHVANPENLSNLITALKQHILEQSA